MKAMIVYTGKYGATRQYSQWLADDLGLPAIPAEKVIPGEMHEADALLIGTPVYFGKLKIRKWLKKNLTIAGRKKLFLFVVNATDPDDQAWQKQVLESSVPVEIRNECTVFFLPGRLIHKELHFLDRWIVEIAAGMQKDPEKKQAMEADLDEVKIENLVPLIKAVNKFRSGEEVKASKLSAPYS